MKRYALGWLHGWLHGWLLSCAALLGGCASTEPVLSWPTALHVEGVPALPTRLLEDVRRYTRIAGHQLVDWHPQREELLLSHRPADASTAQLFALSRPDGPLVTLTQGVDPVRTAEWEPRLGRFLVFARSTGGDEADQLYRLDPLTGKQTRLTDPRQRHVLWGWLNGSSRMLVASVPLDRTSQDGRRSPLKTTVRLIEPMLPEAAQLVVELPGIGWSGGAIAPNDGQVAITRARSSTESELWMLPLSPSAGGPRRILPATDDAPPAVYRPDVFSLDGKSLYLRSDRSSEFRELMQLDLASHQLRRLTADISWDIGAVELSPDGSTLALRISAGGRDELRLLETATGRAYAGVPMPVGTLSRLRWHPRRALLALQVSSAKGPGQVHVLNLGTGSPSLTPWTRPEVPAGVIPSRFAEAQPITWTGLDGLPLSGWLTLPDTGRFAGPRPVVMLMHGGPASQADAGWMGRYHYLVEELGVAVLQPNVRGSSGFGKRFLALDDGRKREDSVQDMGRLLDWISLQPMLDAGRVVIMGGSYGGYMSLAASVHFADRISGAVSTVGISNFVSFLERTESYRRDLRRTEYGDERDPAMRAFLEQISPLNQGDRIRKPLLVVQGRNDPRVPWTESEQIVRNLQARGTPVWYLLADNEGHGFARRENADAYFATVVRFLEHSWGR